MTEPVHGESSAPRADRRGWLVAAFLSTSALLLGWSLYRQGLDLGSDGAWLLGGSRLLDGSGLYRGLEPGDGPLRYWLLAPILSVVSKASALALLRSLGLAFFVGAGVLWLRRRSTRGAGWLWAFALLSLGPVGPGVGLLLLGIGVAATRWRFSAPAMGGLLVATWLVDVRTGIAMLPVAAAAHFSRAPEERGGARGVLLGATATALLAGVALGLGGELEAGLRNTFVHPTHRLVEHFSDGGLLRWWATLDHGAWVRLPFAELRTGEALADLGPLHRFVHVGAYRALVPGVALTLLGLLWGARADRRRLAFIAGGAGASLWWLVSGGDTPSLEGFVLLGSSTILSVLPPPRKDGRPGFRRAALVALAVLLVPLGAESVGLATRLGRPELELYPRGGVFLAKERAARLEEFFSRIQPALARPIVIWPDQAGLYYLFGARPAVPQLALTGLRLPADAWRRDLLAADPQVVLLAQDWNSTAQAFRRRDEALWTTLSEHYRVAGWLRGRTDRLRLLVHLRADQSLDTLPLAERLPQIELTVSNDYSPALRRNLTVGQSFRTGDRDLAGVLFKWRTAGTDLAFDCKLRVWQKTSNEFDSLLSSDVVHLEVPGDGARTFIRIDLPETENAELAVTLELLDDLPEEVRLYWHRHDAGGQEVDLFDEGDALLDLHETDADLYFVAY